MKPKIIFNTTDVERALRMDRSDPEDRVRLVGFIDVMIDALELAFERSIERDDIWLWLDADIGEGSLFRALSANIPAMLTFDFDERDYLEAVIEEMNEVTTKFKPDVLVLPVRNAASDMGQISAPSTSSQMARSMTPIDKYIGMYELAKSFDVDIAWDIRKPRGEWPDPMLQSENALRTISRFQDANLDPTMWIMNLPSVRIVAETLSARAHIDDRNDVMACFALEPIFWTIYRNENQESQDTLPKAVAVTLDGIANMPGNAKVIIGAETYSPCLNQISDSSGNSSDTASVLASRLIAVSEVLQVENQVQNISV